MSIEKKTKSLLGVEGEEIFLDLSRVELFCFQKCVDRSIVSNMLEGIMLKKEFSPVGVTKINEDTYSLTILTDQDGYMDGGHHRAYSHYVAGEKLRCLLVPSKYRALHKPQITIRDIKIQNNSKLDL